MNTLKVRKVISLVLTISLAFFQALPTLGAATQPVTAGANTSATTPVVAAQNAQTQQTTAVPANQSLAEPSALSVAEPTLPAQVIDAMKTLECDNSKYVCSATKVDGKYQIQRVVNIGSFRASDAAAAGLNWDTVTAKLTSLGIGQVMGARFYVTVSKDAVSNRSLVLQDTFGVDYTKVTSLIASARTGNLDDPPRMSFTSSEAGTLGVNWDDVSAKLVSLGLGKIVNGNFFYSTSTGDPLSGDLNFQLFRAFSTQKLSFDARRRSQVWVWDSSLYNKVIQLLSIRKGYGDGNSEAGKFTNLKFSMTESGDIDITAVDTTLLAGVSGPLTRYQVEDLGLSWGDVSKKFLAKGWATASGTEELTLMISGPLSSQLQKEIKAQFGDSYAKVISLIPVAGVRLLNVDMTMIMDYLKMRRSSLTNSQLVLTLLLKSKINWIRSAQEVSLQVDELGSMVIFRDNKGATRYTGVVGISSFRGLPADVINAAVPLIVSPGRVDTCTIKVQSDGRYKVRFDAGYEIFMSASGVVDYASLLLDGYTAEDTDVLRYFFSGQNSSLDSNGIFHLSVGHSGGISGSIYSFKKNSDGGIGITKYCLLGSADAPRVPYEFTARKSGSAYQVTVVTPAMRSDWEFPGGTVIEAISPDWRAAIPYSAVRLTFPSAAKGTLSKIELDWPLRTAVVSGSTQYASLSGVRKVSYAGFTDAQSEIIRSMTGDNQFWILTSLETPIYVTAGSVDSTKTYKWSFRPKWTVTSVSSTQISLQAYTYDPITGYKAALYKSVFKKVNGVWKQISQKEYTV